MDLNNKYIKINNEEEFNNAIKFLESKGFKGNGEYYGSTNYDIIKEVLSITIDEHTILLFNNCFESANHKFGFKEFIIPKEEISLKDKIIKLFKDSKTIIKINNENELRRYIKLLKNLGEFKWGSGIEYSDDISHVILDTLKSQGYYVHYPLTGSRAYIRENDKLIEFKDLLNHI